MAHRIDADSIEIHTGAFCDATTAYDREREYTRIVDAAKIGARLNLGVHAGHGICYHSIKAFKGLSEIRITSYNVCYTKLLRVHITLLPGISTWWTESVSCPRHIRSPPEVFG